jgi:hypothetical protein
MTMDTHKTDRSSTKAQTVHRDCCIDKKCTSGSRNNYYVGKRLTPDTFRLEQNYLVDRRHLLNRAIHGWGVVYGYPVEMASPDKACPGAEVGYLEIGEGLALDAIGRELVQTQRLSLTLENFTLLDRKGTPVRANGCGQKGLISQLEPRPDDCWLLKVHYAEQKLGPITLNDHCSCERHEWDQVCETVHYTLQPIDCKECCKDFDCDLGCCCATSLCCDQYIAQCESEHIHGRGGCRCLCDHLIQLELHSECSSLYQVDECTRADLFNGIGLACVKLDRDECGNWRFSSVYDACGPRRLVKRNDLLFDLIQGGDVTRICEIGWQEWHRSETPVTFEAFSNAFGKQGNGEVEYVTNNFWVKFSRPVRAHTVRPDCFAVTVLGAEREGGWWQVLRVPIVRVDTAMEPAQNNDPPGYVRAARIVVDGGWVEDAVRGRATVFHYQQTWIEIEIRGDFIVDCNGQTVDANARGLLAAPTGNGSPGNTFLSTFMVEKRPGDVSLRANYSEQRSKGD